MNPGDTAHLRFWRQPDEPIVVEVMLTRRYHNEGEREDGPWSWDFPPPPSFPVNCAVESLLHPTREAAIGALMDDLYARVNEETARHRRAVEERERAMDALRELGAWRLPETP